MDRLQKHYAHTAWTPADPLSGMEAYQRRAILLMPSTFAERLRLAPWRTYEKRRVAMFEIIAERRVLYDLMYDRQQPTPAAALAAGSAQPAPPEAVSPYYAYRLELHRRTVEALAEDRRAEDRHELAVNPAARADRQLRDQQRRQLLELEIERRKLDLKELDILAGKAEPPEPTVKPLTADLMAAPLSAPMQSSRPRRKRAPSM